MGTRILFLLLAFSFCKIRPLVGFFFAPMCICTSLVMSSSAETATENMFEWLSKSVSTQCPWLSHHHVCAKCQYIFYIRRDNQWNRAKKIEGIFQVDIPQSFASQRRSSLFSLVEYLIISAIYHTNLLPLPFPYHFYPISSSIMVATTRVQLPKNEGKRSNSKVPFL